MIFGVLILILSFFSFQNISNDQSVYYLEKMISVIDNIETLEYELVSEERIADKIFCTHSKVKLNVSPFKCYTYVIKPNNGVEILLNSSSDYALVNPNGFPFMNIRLDPLGKILRKDQHNTLFDSGFKIIRDVTYFFIDVLKASPNHYLKDNYIASFLERTCYVLKIHNPDFFYKSYTVKEKETIYDIALKYNLSSYHILVKNNLSFYTDISKGDKILLPNSYGQSFEIWIDTETFLPVVQKIFIEGKLFENYQFNNIIINQEFDDNEFSENYHEYNF